MNYLLLEITHRCPHCGLNVTSNEEISILFGWRKLFRSTKDPLYVMIPQSWCIQCRSKEARRYE